MAEFDDLLESYPDDLIESLAHRDDWRTKVSNDNVELEFLVSDVDRWPPGSTVTVAFLGGDGELHRRIAAAVGEIELVCNLKFDFGARGCGTMRQWSLNDSETTADIRVSFDMKGYWSLVGMASVDPTVGSESSGVGGRPYQRSLNLSGFDRALPETWRRTVLHEFLHSVAFKHEHQILHGPCATAFRWEDDGGYAPTRDGDGRYVTDDRGRRPGIYTFLSGHPNNWSKGKVDHNLRAVDHPGASAGSFDRKSVMLYRFPELFYKTWPNECSPEGQGDILSAGDCEGLQHLYPYDEESIEHHRTRSQVASAALEQQQTLESVGLESPYVEASQFLMRRREE